MISDEQLDRYRIEGTLLRIVRDADPANDVRGFVVAWDDSTVMIRKRTRRVVKLDRAYHYELTANRERSCSETRKKRRDDLVRRSCEAGTLCVSHEPSSWEDAA